MGHNTIAGIHTDGTVALIVIACGAIIAGLLLQIATWWLLAKTTGRFPASQRFLDQTAAPARYFFPLLLLQFVWLSAPDLAWIPFAIHLVRIATIAALTWMVVRCIAAITDTVIAARPHSTQEAQRIRTQAVVLSRSAKILVLILGFALILMTFPGARALGASLLASAGLAGIIAGVAARPVLANLIAGMQIALSQPFRLDDVLIVQGEWGRVEEITSTYVSLRLWDERRLIIPLQWFIENTFENWTRLSSGLIGAVIWWVDYRMPLQPLRDQLTRICESASEWDGSMHQIEVTDASERAIQIRALVTARNSGDTWTLRCKVREAMIAFMQSHYGAYLPRQRHEVELTRG